MRYERPDLVAVLDHYDIDHSDRRSQKIRCPHPEHEDTTASCSLELEKGVWNCFACGRAGDSITLIQAREGMNVAEAFEFGSAFAAGGSGRRVRGQPERGRPLAAGKGYQPKYRRVVPARAGARRPFA